VANVKEGYMSLGTTPIAPCIDEHNGASPDLVELMTVADVAELLKVSKSWVYEHTRLRAKPHSDRLPHVKIGKYVRFDPHCIRAFLDHQTAR
jgi:excisionase family DNA binding protein